MAWVMGQEPRGASEEGERIFSFDPVSGERIGEVCIGSQEDVLEAMGRARTAQVAWAERSLEERCEVVLSCRDAMVDHAEELITLLSRETGKPRVESLTHELMVAADLAGYYAKRASRILAPREIEMHLLKHRRSYVHYAPRGVIGIISPWNFPLVIPIGDTLTALIAGNAVLLKPSEVTPLIAGAVRQVFLEAGLPEGLFQVITGDGATGAALIDARPDKVVFTGSVGTGRKVAAACGERLIPCTMELGGKAAAIVCADADLERTARAIVFGGFANCGQVCVSVERVYVHAAVYETLVDRVVELVGELRQGDPSEPTTDVGAMTFPRQMEVVEGLLADAIERGAEVRAGGHRKVGAGQFFEPTILTGCDQEMAVMREEIFGPIVPMMRVRNEEEALRLANDSPLGLMGYVFTRDKHRGRRLAERVRCGTVMINDVLSAYGAPETPFGGVKDSGYGRVHGEEGLRAMCEIRHVNYDRIAIKREPVWFPYSERSYVALLKATRLLFRRGSRVKKLLDLF